MADTNSLIEELSRKPAARALSRPMRMVIPILGALAVYGMLALWWLEVRPDLGQQLSRPWFVAELLALVALAAGSVVAAVHAMYPDLCQRRWLLKLPYLSFMALAGILLVQLFLPADARLAIPEITAHTIECTVCIAAVALLPSALLFTLIRSGASVHPLHAGSCAVLAATAVACLALRLSEANDSVTHLIAFHYLPTLLMAALGARLGQWLLKW
jgi:hypothetical protein